MIVRLVLFAVVVCLASIILKENFKSGAIILTIAGCISIVVTFANVLSDIRNEISVLDAIEGVNSDAVSLILKTLLVAYLTGFGSDICTDAGEKAIANALEIAGKAIMLSMATPMLIGIFKSVKEIMGV